MPRDGRVVVIVNGYNDLLVPASSGTRPGDPLHLALRYSQFFGNGFVWWLAQHSAIVNATLRNEVEGNVLARRRNLNENDAAFARYATAVTDIYIENVTEMLASCEAQGRACLVGMQPSRSLTAAHLGRKVDDVLSQDRVRQLYEMLQAKIAASPYRARFVDMTGIFDSPSGLEYFADTVHPDDRGQAVVAQTLFPRVAEAVRSAGKPPAVADRCSRKRSP